MSMENPTHPGAGIQDDIEELRWTVTAAGRGDRSSSVGHRSPNRAGDQLYFRPGRLEDSRHGARNRRALRSPGRRGAHRRAPALRHGGRLRRPRRPALRPAPSGGLPHTRGHPSRPPAAAPGRDPRRRDRPRQPRRLLAVLLKLRRLFLPRRGNSTMRSAKRTRAGASEPSCAPGSAKPRIAKSSGAGSRKPTLGPCSWPLSIASGTTATP